MMDRSRPTERSQLDQRQPPGERSARLRIGRPPQSSGQEWLSEFLAREGVVQESIPVDRDPGNEPAAPARQRKSHAARVIAGGVLLALGLAGAVVYDRMTSSQQVRQAAPPAVAPRLVAPRQRPEGGSHQAVLSGSAIDLPDVQRQPVHSPPSAPATSSIGPEVARPQLAKPAIADAAKALPPGPATSIAAQSAEGLHLLITHAASGPAEASRVDSLISALRSDIGNIAKTTVTTGPAAPRIIVEYFTADDHASARRIAASLGRIARTPYQVMLGHAQPLPSPGTIEIRLPR